jgi:hypothetical protein
MLVVRQDLLVKETTMLNSMKKLAALTLLGATASASASVVTVDDGTNSQTFDQLVVTTQGDSTITQTYVDGVNDPFVELGLTAVATFKQDGSTVGFPNTFDLIFDVNLVGTAATTDLGGGVFDIDVNFGPGSTAVFKHDDVAFGGLNGTVTDIANLSNAMGGCDLQVDVTDIDGSNNEGTCNIRFDFDALLAGWFETSWGDDFTALTSQPYIDFALDIDITSYVPVFTGPGGSPVAGDITTIEVQHDGSAVISVPEPASIAILGLGLLGLAGARRRA